MKNILVSCIVFLFAFHQLKGQTMLSSQVVDATTGKSIPYVNVRIAKKLKVKSLKISKFVSFLHNLSN